jgi:hypothetical protein
VVCVVTVAHRTAGVPELTLGPAESRYMATWNLTALEDHQKDYRFPWLAEVSAVLVSLLKRSNAHLCPA